MVNLTVPAIGEDDDVWGGILNTALTTLNNAKVEKAELVYNVKDYGATGDGVTDDTDAIMATVAATRAGTTAGVAGGDILFPPGKYVITETLNLYRFSGVLRGSGMGNPPTYPSNPGSGTVLKWEGSAGEPMLLLRDYKMMTISDIRFEGKTSAMPSYAIESRYNTGDDVGTCAQLIIDRVHIGTWPFTLSCALAAGIGFTGDNGNNDQWTISNVSILGCAVGIDLPNSQSIWGKLDHVLVNDASTAGIRSAASFTGINVQFDLCAIDLLLTSASNCTILGWWSERSSLIFQATHTATINVFGGKWYLQTANMTGGVMFKHDVLTSGAVVNLYGVEINTAISPHPKVQLRGAGGGNRGSDFRMVGCMAGGAPGMTMADFDVTNTNNSTGMRVLIDSFGMLHRELLTNGETLGTTQWVETPRSKVGTIHLRDNAGALEKSTDGTTWTAVADPPVWAAWTPVLSGTGWAVGNATVTARYTTIGKTVHWFASITFGSTSTFGTGGLLISLPVTKAAAVGQSGIAADATDQGSGAYQMWGRYTTTTTATVYTVASTGVFGSVTATLPFTWVATDALNVWGTYEAA